MKARGGKAVYGAAVGILMLEARFPRIPGDMGHAGTWPFPVLYEVVRGASPDRVVRRGAPGLEEAFVAAARKLVADGADGITTNCGFLSPFQAPLAAAVAVPVLTSALMQVPLVERLLPPGRRVGVLTVSGSTLEPRHLEAAGAAADTPIASTEHGRAFSRTILDDVEELDVELARADNVQAAQDLVHRHPEVGAIVLECTNMTPYQADVAAAVGRPTYSMADFVTWFHAGLVPRRYPPAAG